MSSKLSKRARYVVKWNGPHSLGPAVRRQNKAALGKGTLLQRQIAYFYECRYHGKEPCNLADFLSNPMPSASKKKQDAIDAARKLLKGGAP